MAEPFVYKPYTRKGPVFLSHTNPGSPPVIIGPNGQRFTARRGDQAGGVFFGHEGYQWVFPKEVLALQGAKLEYGGQSGNIGSGQMSYRGSSLTNWQESGKTGANEMGGGAPGGFAPGQVGYGFHPAYLGGAFPNPMMASFNSIQAAPFKYTDTLKFGKKFAEFSRQEIIKNSKLAKDLSLEQIDTEIEGLKRFVPEATALKRQTIAEDNAFNVTQRGEAVDTALPGVRDDLFGQEQRANAYASGRVPDEVLDASLERTLRSRAADRAGYSGFAGAAGNRISDLLSAEIRIQLSQYGDQLLSGNINQRAGLFLPPTEYSDAGGQIRVTPSVSIAGLSQSNLGNINSLSNLTAGQALSTEVGQQQFITGVEQQTRQFNAQGEFQESQFNANTGNQFALQKFAYDVGFAGTVAGAHQTNANTQLELQQQEQARQTSNDAASQVATGQTYGAIGQAVGTVAGAIGGAVAAGAGGGGTQAPPAGYSSAEGQGGGSGSIIVPSGAAIPPGYEAQGPAQGGGTIAVPSSRKPRPSSSGGGNPPPTSNEDFDTSDPSQGGGLDSDDSFAQPDREPAPEGDSFGTPPPNEDTSPPPQDEESIDDDAGFKSQPVNGNMQSFTSETGVQVPNKMAQGEMINHASAVLSNAGIYTQPAPGTQTIGVDNSGKELHGNTAMMKSQNDAAGTQAVDGFVNSIAPLGVFTPKDREILGQIAQVSGSVALINQLMELRRKGDTKQFINTLAQALKQPTIEAISNDPKNRAGLNGVYTAFNLFNNWDRMSNAQRGLAIASLGLQGFYFATGENLAKKPIIQATATRPGLTVGQALGLFQQGYNVYALATNWDQLSDLQRINAGIQSAAGLVRTGRQLGLLGSGTGGSAVNISAQQLSSAGWTPAPANGVGAVTAPVGTDLPPGYTQLPPNADGSVNAIPSANADTASGISANQVAGGAMVATGAINVYDNWGEGGEEGAINGFVGGSQMAAGLSTMGQTNPYVLGAVIAGSTLGGVIKDDRASAAVGVGTAGAAGYGAYTAQASNAAAGSSTASQIGTTAAVLGGAYSAKQIQDSDASDEEKAEASGRLVKQTAGAITSFGISAVAQAADHYIFKGRGQKFADKVDSYNPADKYIVTPVAARAHKVIDAALGGKNKAQGKRDNIRNFFQSIKATDSNDSVALGDGTRVSLGVDGHGEERPVSNPNLLTKEHKDQKIERLHAYDIDYTNDLDFASGMAGVALSRVVSGNKNTEIDQMGGQIGNAALKNIGFGKEMSEENFAKMAQNQRAIYAQFGVKSKEAAIQLINQAYGEKRLNDFDAAQARQAANMIFDKNGYDLAQKLLGGRFRGIEVASQPGSFTSKPSPLPIGGAKPIGRGTVDDNMVSRTPQFQGNQQQPTGQSIDTSGFVPQGQSDIPTGPAVQRSPFERSSRKRLSRDEIIARNEARYSMGATA